VNMTPGRWRVSVSPGDFLCELDLPPILGSFALRLQPGGGCTRTP
jgi:hypothetical protein